MLDLMWSLTSTMAAFSTTPLESLESSVLGEKVLNLKKVLSHAAGKLQRGFSDLVKLKRKVSTRAESSTA